MFLVIFLLCVFLLIICLFLVLFLLGFGLLLLSESLHEFGLFDEECSYNSLLYTLVAFASSVRSAHGSLSVGQSSECGRSQVRNSGQSAWASSASLVLWSLCLFRRVLNCNSSACVGDKLDLELEKRAEAESG